MTSTSCRMVEESKGGEADEDHEHEGGCINDGDCNVFSDYRFDEERIEELFEKLDVNQDGRLDINELSDGLHRLKIHRSPEQAEVGCPNPPHWPTCIFFGPFFLFVHDAKSLCNRLKLELQKIW